MASVFEAVDEFIDVVVALGFEFNAFAIYVDHPPFEVPPIGGLSPLE